ncbi:L-type lectin-domain containing receptor kinase S.4-like [Chenopodium quinoa]|uniref:L-type lectin-domain containing receptor kinase S.4-like n=1 Tax=Chenopodium quinoa TaxID=63459 RepID=UPI000B7917EF|nr:L-type lectin-domain containing receptor kinase S.4-like [Chenopodium quinoa]
MFKNFNLLGIFSLLLIISTAFAQQTEFLYEDFSKAGSTIILKDAAKLVKHDSIIQLTNTTSRMIGHAFYSTPIKFKNTQNDSVLSFSSVFTIGTVPEFKTLGGHGMAFIVSPSNNLPKALPSQYLGLFNAADIGNITNHIFAVEFDTVQDFEFGDINDNHVGIDLNGLVSNFSVPATYIMENSTKQNVSMKNGHTIQAWIDYDATNHLINVTISPFSTKPSFPLISYKYDLTQILEEEMYVGFAAATGLLASSHYVLGWSFNMSGPAKSLPMPPLPHPSSTSNSKHKETMAISLSISVSIFIFLFIICVIYVIIRIRDREIIEEWELTVGPHRFRYHELKEATRGFKEKELLGRGGFGRVYKGSLKKCNTQIAVKRINHESKQGLPEFVAEIASIGRLCHRNLVQLLGWGRRRGDLLLVYDYMPNGSLDKYLFDQGQQGFLLSWEQRFRIIKGVASGLLYLHEGWEKVVIHRDIKASNVLLDGDFNGRLGDFGLARLHDHGADLGTTRVVGTLGYLAPELSRTGHVTTCSDVFAFGALLLEVVCGRRPIEPRFKTEELVLVDWVWSKWNEGKIMEVIDAKLSRTFNREEALMVLKLGLMCSCDDPRFRPSMRVVVRYLDGEMALPEVLRAPNSDDELRVSSREPRHEDFVYSFATSSSEVSVQSHSTGDRTRVLI